VRSSSRQGIGTQPRHLAIFIAVRRDHVSMLGDCVSIATLPSRPNLGAILPLHDVRYHARALVTLNNLTFDVNLTLEYLGLTACAENILCERAKPPLWWSQTGSNRRPPACKAGALPTELWPLRRGPPSPRLRRATFGSDGVPTEAAEQRRLVGLGRFELPTSRLSSARSNQLSYKPMPGVSNQWSVIRRRLITDYRLLIPVPGSFAKKEK
jgi:hypothetical protein